MSPIISLRTLCVQFKLSIIKTKNSSKPNIHKVSKNIIQSLFFTQGPSASAYVTYYKSEDALRAIQAVNNVVADGRTLKASLGTTKYCSHFMKNMPCPKHDCMYLHELGNYHSFGIQYRLICKKNNSSN